jgi:thiamine biosynthesis lipoprotein ApbE
MNEPPPLSVSSVSSVLSVVNLAVYAMGTRFEFILVGEDESHLRTVGEEAIAEIQYLHEKFSYFSKSSIVTHINERATYEAVDVDRETFELLELCHNVWEQSEGAFDITIAPLMHEYGFREDVHRDGTAIQFGMRCVELDRNNRTIHFAQPGMAIDLGGVAILKNPKKAGRYVFSSKFTSLDSGAVVTIKQPIKITR